VTRCPLPRAGPRHLGRASLQGPSPGVESGECQAASVADGPLAQPARPPFADPAPPLPFLPLVPYSARAHGCALVSEGLDQRRQGRDPPDGDRAPGSASTGPSVSSSGATSVRGAPDRPRIRGPIASSILPFPNGSHGPAFLLAYAWLPAWIGCHNLRKPLSQNANFSHRGRPVCLALSEKQHGGTGQLQRVVCPQALLIYIYIYIRSL
jgi:hypothetical protein